MQHINMDETILLVYREHNSNDLTLLAVLKGVRQPLFIKHPKIFLDRDQDWYVTTVQQQ